MIKLSFFLFLPVDWQMLFLPYLFCLTGRRLIPVTALKERAEVSRLISSAHKAAVLVFLAGGFTLRMLWDRSWGGEYWPSSWASLPLRLTSLTTTWLALLATPKTCLFACLCLYLRQIYLSFHDLKWKLGGFFFFSLKQVKENSLLNVLSANELHIFSWFHFHTDVKTLKAQ